MRMFTCMRTSVAVRDFSSAIISSEYSVLRVPLIRDRIPSVAQSVPLTY